MDVATIARVTNVIVLVATHAAAANRGAKNRAMRAAVAINAATIVATLALKARVASRSSALDSRKVRDDARSGATPIARRSVNRANPAIRNVHANRVSRANPGNRARNPH